MSEEPGGRGDRERREGRSAADVRRSFDRAWADSVATSAPAPELVPARLAEVVKQAARCDGAGVSMLSRGECVPLGASDEDAMTVERLQFTVGDGPCLEALRGQRTVRADDELVRRSWPVFHEVLIRHTRYRSIVAVPLDIGASVSGVMDMYFADPGGAAAVGTVEVMCVAESVSRIMREASVESPQAAPDSDLDVASWVYAPSATRRSLVWLALGLIMAEGHDPIDALAVLRAHAWAREVSIDALAHDLVLGVIDPGALTAD